MRASGALVLAGPTGRPTVRASSPLLEVLMDPDSVAGQMRSAATVLLKALTGRQRELAARPFADDAARRWLEYRPRPRPGACIADMSTDARKAAHRLFDKCCTRSIYRY